MKSFKDVEATRREYHANHMKNSVHRSSLMVPEIPNSQVELTFVNHFLIKRDIRDVTCRVSAVDLDGNFIEARMHSINEKRVYRIPLSGMVDKEVGNYIIEFYTADNLFIPFPACMVNHSNERFINYVHSYNRILNDAFEDDKINQINVKEASVDLATLADMKNFFLFTSGPVAFKGNVTFEIKSPDVDLKKEVSIDVPKFANQYFDLEEVFGTTLPKAGVIKVQQPSQFLFYGRMLAGQRSRSGEFIANHSYYDCSDVEEYWDDDRPSSRTIAIFKDLDAAVRIYPIQSPSELRIGLTLHRIDGGEIAYFEEIGILRSPDVLPFDFQLQDFLKDKGLESNNYSSFTISATPMNGGKTPTRVSFQQVYGSGGLESSINFCMNNPNVFVPEKKSSFSWGQVIAGAQMEAWLGIILDPLQKSKPSKQHSSYNVELNFYDELGHLAKRNIEVRDGESRNFRIEEELKEEIEKRDATGIHFIWYTSQADYAGLSSVTVCRHKESGHVTGEHGF